MIPPSYTLDDLIALAEPYGVTVRQVVHHDLFRFNFIGKFITIRADIGDEDATYRSAVHTRHRYYVLRGCREAFPHPVVRDVKVSVSQRFPTITDHIEEVIQAAMHEIIRDAREDMGALGKRDKAYEKLRIYSDQHGQCYYCEKPVTVREATIDHIQPLSRGGKDLPINWCIACLPCNREKGSMTAEEFRAYQSTGEKKQIGYIGASPS